MYLGQNVGFFLKREVVKKSKSIIDVFLLKQVKNI